MFWHPINSVSSLVNVGNIFRQLLLEFETNINKRLQCISTAIYVCDLFKWLKKDNKNKNILKQFKGD